MYWNSWMPARAYIRMKAPFRHWKEGMGKLVTDQWAKGYPGNPSGLTIYLPSGSNPYLSEDLENV